MLNPQNQKIGERWLIQQRGYRYPIQEVTFLEWSKSGKHVKLEFMRGHIDWNDPTEFSAIEKLPSLPYSKVDIEIADDILLQHLHAINDVWRDFQENIDNNKKELR
jgi:hypothetical protein